MPQPRRTAWALVCALLATAAFAGGSGVALATVPAPQCTGWNDVYHPPPNVRVLRSDGPLKGGVELVPFWKYVGTVVRAEYSTGFDRPPLWMRVGAITVKQYGWFYSMRWRGGFVTNTDGSHSCYDLKDTTADQIYKPEKADPAHPDPADPLHWMPGNVATTANLKAMDETWHITLRKWMTTKLSSRLFLTGYRSGKRFPCGADSTGFKIYQKSLRDCSAKNLTLEETLRAYFEPNFQLVDTRGHDVLSDSGGWRGDLAVLSAGPGSGTAWKLFVGQTAPTDTFTSGPADTFPNVDFAGIRGQGVGDVDGDRLADLVMLTNAGAKLQFAKATGTGFAAPTSMDVSPADRLLVADFDGDLLVDAGLLRLNGGQATLTVMRGLSTGGFGSATDWWTGALAAQDVALAGDTNGDGKADLIVRDATSGALSVAASFASCADLTVWGACPVAAVGAVGLAAAAVWLSQSAGKTVVGDFNRDGRDDVLTVTVQGTDIVVSGMKSKTDGTFADPQELWRGGSASSIGDLVPVAMNVNADGLADLAIMQKDGTSSKVFWLKSVEQSSVPASMTMGPVLSDSLPWGGAKPF